VSTGLVRCDLAGKEWIVSGDPYVLTRLKNTLSLAKRRGGDVVVPALPEPSRELLWFKQMFPMTVTPEIKLRSLAASWLMDQDRAESVLNGTYNPPVIKFARGESPRDYQWLAANLFKTKKSLLLADDVGVGKAQPLSCKVLTKAGWKRMGDISVGDEVIDPDGGYGVVTGVFERGLMDVFRVTTNDGRSTKCCDEHLWHVQTANDRARKSSRVVPLSEIRGNLLRATSGNVLSNWFLPLAVKHEGIEFEGGCVVPKSITPYVLGCLIGDGCIQQSAVGISCYDESVRGNFSKELPYGVTLRRENIHTHDYRVSGGNGNASNPVVSDCRRLGLSGKRSWEKKIPKYIFSIGSEGRMECLKGLMDTDGTVNASGSNVSYSTVSEKLAMDVRRLVESLGGFASITTKKTSYTYLGEKKSGRLAYNVSIRIPECPFKCTKKIARYKFPYMARAIRSIEPCGTELVRCIAVSTKRNLYITDGHIVTHNTATAIAAIADPALRPACIITPNHLIAQWKGQLRRFTPGLTVHEIKQTEPYSLELMVDCPSCGATVDTVNGTRQLSPKCPVCKHKFPNTLTRRPADVTLLAYSKMLNWPNYVGSVCKTVAFEEGHALRSHDTKRWRAAHSIAKQCEYRVAITATPLFNLGGEAWNILECVRPGFLGSKAEFKETWCGGSGPSGKEPPLLDPEAFGAYLKSSHIMLRRKAVEVGIPVHDCQIIHQTVDADTEVFSKETSRADEMARIILGEARSKSRGMETIQFDAIMRQATGLAKVNAITAFTEMLLEQDEPVVMFAWHQSVHNLYMERLAKWNPCKYTGQEKPMEKEANVEKFVRGDSKVIIISLRAGEGLDGLQQVCCTAVVAELDWTWSVPKQNIGRIARDGQTRPCKAYFMVSEFGSDPIVSQVLGLKKDQLNGLIGERVSVPTVAFDSAAEIKRLARAHLNRSLRA